MEIDGSAYTSADVAYLYDDAYQLTSEVRTGGDAYTQTLCYDASGNRTKKTLGGTDTTYLYNTADQLTSETTGGTTTEYEYDANGALTKSDDGTTENVYTYDYDGYLTAFDTTGTDNDTTYTYDSGKRRICKVVDSDTAKYFLDGANVIADFDGDDVLQATYITPGLDDNVSLATGGSTYYYLKDGLGSIRNLIDSNEATQNTYDYYAFGNELGSWTENVTNRCTYTAREYDGESEQYYYRARYYAGGGRFSQRDPARSGVNIYAYVSGNPIRYADPRGLIQGEGKYEFCQCPNGHGVGWKSVQIFTHEWFGSRATPSTHLKRARGYFEQCCIWIKIAGGNSYRPLLTLQAFGNDLTLHIPANHAFEGDLILMSVAQLLEPGDHVHGHWVKAVEGLWGSDVHAYSFTSYWYDVPPAHAFAVENGQSARTVAHEIGHVLLGELKVQHHPDPENLMYGNPPGWRLTEAQCDSMRKHELVK
ncbi:MAG: RHS repeat domain-containing protein [Planctomycetota bacterium]